ncbi:putative RNA polymerase ECF-subfamily sigma factor [Actinoplanes missouriensis 431]|uniref:Putative RNA polymerase ECF-subfamily sigma factor n=1 Tax=Actinoplanes missouriensis (strain ATCC 14538 / DSM 43046 / CBS 188.64 / JCM 3121 / NBRC 102363 / NCIMB 12654 / NRRL B-3342 / UNCC 431) TaxID=512565 RepID=I0HJH2_ACTM4|nr:RNA polymerase sigma factor [Actinoplanes missouriensis]BAL93159.1 putative RNA polymerase ECF-subfamily sigma factor [Actinoplanes missouriensis 431]
MTGPQPDGAEDWFRALHQHTFADLLRFVERRVPADDAEDIVSTVYLTAWRRRTELPEDARPWLFAVARKTMANRTRGWLRRRALDVRLTAAGNDATPDPATGLTARLDLQRAWQTLSAADREVLALVAFDDLTNEQAATVLGCRRSAFTMRLARARKRLHAALEPAGATSSHAHTFQEQSWTKA